MRYFTVKLFCGYSVAEAENTACDDTVMMRRNDGLGFYLRRVEEDGQWWLWCGAEHGWHEEFRCRIPFRTLAHDPEFHLDAVVR